MENNELALRATDFEVPAGDFSKKVFFPNGYGVSVIRHHGSYGNQAGLFEAAVLNPDGELDYTTEVTSDVEGWLTPGDVVAFAAKVATLPSAIEASPTKAVEGK